MPVVVRERWGRKPENGRGKLGVRQNERHIRMSKKP